jgi:hydrogenase nickel incorporation protein HypA/HybF
MHEASLVQSLLAQSARILEEHGGRSVESIRVEIGPLSGVEPLLVKSAFERMCDSTPCRGAILTIEEVPLSARCRRCRAEFEIEAFQFVCPSCEATSIQVMRGDEFRLLEVTIHDADEDAGIADAMNPTCEHAAIPLRERVR